MDDGSAESLSAEERGELAVRSRLWQYNYDAYNYGGPPENAHPDLLAEVEESGDLPVRPDYTFESLPGDPAPDKVQRLIDFYIYQCEGDDWPGTDVERMGRCRGIRMKPIGTCLLPASESSAADLTGWCAEKTLLLAAFAALRSRTGAGTAVEIGAPDVELPLPDEPDQDEPDQGDSADGPVDALGRMEWVSSPPGCRPGWPPGSTPATTAATAATAEGGRSRSTGRRCCPR